MATDVERLIVRLEVSQARFERQMANMSNTANRRARQVETRFAQMNNKIQSQFTGLGARLGGVLAGALTVQSAARFIDSSIRIQNALKSTGLEGEELRKVYDRLFDAAQRNSAPVESLVQLYSRLAIVQGELNASSAEIEQFSGTIAAVLRAGGTSAQEASGAITQLTQALGGGVVRAEEFGSILEGAPTIARAAAFGIKEAGGSVAELRKLMLDGKISSEAFFRGIEAGAPAVTRAMGDAQRTISDSFTNLYNSLTRAAEEFNQSSEAANLFGSALDNLATFVEQVDFGSVIGQIDNFIDRVAAGITATSNLIAEISRLTGLENVGRFLEGSAGFRALGGYSVANRRDRIQAEGYEGSAALDAFIRRNYGGAPAPKSGRVAAPSFQPVEVNPISLADYAAPGDADGSKKGRAGSKRTPDEQFARDVEQIRERTSAIQAETAAMGALNPLIDDYGYALEKTRAEQDLLTAAKSAGVAVTPELRQQITALATGYASASVEANKLAESQDEVRRNAEDMQALGKDVMGGFIGDVKDGISATEALANALDKVGSKLLDIALDGLFTSKKGSGGGLLAGLGSLFGGRGFASGTANTGGRRGQPRGLVHGQEAVIPLPAGGKVPVDVRLPAAASRGSSGNRVFNIDARGAQQGVGEEIRAALVAYDRQLDRTIGTKIAGARNMFRPGF